MAFLRPCLYCGEKKQLKYPARFKQDVRKFCTLHCAARLGAQRTENHTWCYRHGVWHDVEGVRLCLEERAGETPC